MSRDTQIDTPISLAASGVDSVIDSKLASANKHTFDIDGAVSIKAKLGTAQTLKVVATGTDEILNLKLAGVTQFEFRKYFFASSMIAFFSSADIPVLFMTRFV